MMPVYRQAKIFTFIALIFIFAASQVYAARNASDQGEKTIDRPLSVDELLDGVDSLIPDFFSSKAAPAKRSSEKEPAKTSDKEAAKEGAKEKAAEAIPAKRGSQPASAPEKKPEPYKVYAAPVIAEEPAPTAGAVPVQVQGTTSAPKVMPLTRSVEQKQEPFDLTETMLDDMKGRPAKPVSVSGPVMSYLPILPLGAAANTKPQLLPVFGNYDLGGDHSAITRAIIFIHDISRKAGEGVSSLMSLAGADNGAALVLAPQFIIESDVGRVGEKLGDKGRSLARWPLSDKQGLGWQFGDESVAVPPQKGISSFTVVDVLLLYMADRRTFPNLQQIVIAGHGVGADFVQRYAAVGQAPGLLASQGIGLGFLVANPSSFIYFTGSRPAEAGPNFVKPDTTQCPRMDDYPYGLNNLAPYARRLGGNAIRLNYPGRRVMVLLSDKIAGDNFMDAGCEANAQGKDRVARAKNYERYLLMSYGDTARKTQSFTLVPNAGYDPVALFGSYCGQAMLFGDGVCVSTLMPHEEMQSRN